MRSQSASQAYTSTRPATVTLSSNGNQSVGVVIDAKGLILCHRCAVNGRVQATSQLGRKYNLQFMTLDPVTGLELFRAPQWSEPTASVVQVGPDLMAGQRVFAVLKTGIVTVDVVGKAFGIMEEGKRYVPLTEVRFEQDASYGGAPLIDGQGRLVGFLGANLRQSEAAAPMAKKVMSLEDQRLNLTQNSLVKDLGLRTPYGPGGLATAYAASPATLRRVVEAFKSPNPKLKYPAIGVLCKASPMGGAEVVSVRSGHPAERAGIREGDVIVGINGMDITDFVSFGEAVWKLPVGQKVSVQVRRGDNVESLVVLVGEE